jgi:hypothetical protein
VQSQPAPGAGHEPRGQRLQGAAAEVSGGVWYRSNASVAGHTAHCLLVWFFVHSR